MDHRETVLTLCKTLLNEERLLLLGLMAQQPTSLVTLLEISTLPEATLQRHLRLLVESGIVGHLLPRAASEQEVYYLDVPALQQLKQRLFAPPAAPPPPSPEAEILARFVQDGVLQHIPRTGSKLQIVLAWLVTHFEPGKSYHELEVNKILKPIHPDCATLRRALVDYGYLQRERNHYQRLSEDER